MFKLIKFKWINGKANQSLNVADNKNQTSNNSKRASRQPKRSQKAFYIQPKYSSTFDKLAFEQKKLGGKSAPELSELALELLFEKFQIPFER